MRHWFACEIDEVLEPAGSRRTPLHRIDRGFAITDGSEDIGFDIHASSEPFDDVTRQLDEQIGEAVATNSLTLPDRISVRALNRVAATSDGDVRHLTRTNMVTLYFHGMTMVTTPDNAIGDSELLLELAARTPIRSVDPFSMPITWSIGSGAVLLHEAIGHPAERGLLAGDWPTWLSVEDAPTSGHLLSLESDDVARTIATADLSQDRPTAMRRWSHRDVPMRRLTNLVGRGSGRPLSDLPDPRIDVLFVSQGNWDPVLDIITLRIDAADLVDKGRRVPIAPFVFRVDRAALPDRLSGWYGVLTRYPGVLCSEEGVRLPVGSASVGLLTEPT